MKFRISAQQYSVLSKRLQVIALGILIVASLTYTIISYAHVDMIGAEGATNAVNSQQEANERHNSQAPTPEQSAQNMRDAVDRARRDHERNRDRNSSPRDGDRSDGDRSGGGSGDRSDNSNQSNDREPSRGGRSRN